MSNRVHARLPTRPVPDCAGRQHQVRLGQSFGTGPASRGAVGADRPEPRLVVVVEPDAHAGLLAKLTLGDLAQIVGCASRDDVDAAIGGRGNDILLICADLHLTGTVSSLELARKVVECWPGTHMLLIAASPGPGRQVAGGRPREPRRETNRQGEARVDMPTPRVIAR